MLDKSIDGALLALRKQIIREGQEGLAEVETLLRLRGVPMPRVMQPKAANTARRYHMRLMVQDALKDGPRTRKQIVAHIAPMRPDVPPDRLYWRVDAALAKMRKAGQVRCEAGVWLAP